MVRRVRMKDAAYDAEAVKKQFYANKGEIIIIGEELGF